MKNIIVMVVAGGGLFVGSVVGLLGAMGRLNYEGTQGIPVLSGMFEAPPEEEPEEGAEGDPNADDPQGKAGEGADGDGTDDRARNLSGIPDESKELEDMFAPAEKGGGHGAPPPAADGDQGEGKDTGFRELDDIFAKEEAGAHGAAPKGAPEGSTTQADVKSLQKHNQRPQSSDGAAASSREHQRMLAAMENAQPYEYETGGFFRFQGQQASISPAQINDYVKKTAALRKALDEREKAIDGREAQLRVREDDLLDQQRALAEARQGLEERQREIDDQVRAFNQTVLLITKQEEPILKNQAKQFETMLEVAEKWVKEQWQTEQGQREATKTIYYMSKDSQGKLLASIGQDDLQLFNEIIQKLKEIALDGNGKK